MIKKTIRAFDRVFPPKPVYAHCDIPCGIYDPHHAQMAAHTVLRMTNLINELKASSKEPPFNERKKIISQTSRLTAVKEEHAELVKHEVRIIWGDYIKPEHLEKYPEIHQLVFDIMKIASKAKQNVDVKIAEELLSKVQKFAEIFWKTKDKKPVKVAAPYPSGGEIVLHN